MEGELDDIISALKIYQEEELLKIINRKREVLTHTNHSFSLLVQFIFLVVIYYNNEISIFKFHCSL